jgi:hypothetical protein
MKKSPSKVVTRNLKVKDLSPVSNARNIKGGATGPCDRKRK